MTETEFAKWWDVFKPRFPTVSNWLKPETCRSWASVLSDVELPDAIAATKSLHVGDVDFPKIWDMIPATIRREAKRRKESRRENERRENPQWKSQLNVVPFKPMPGEPTALEEFEEKRRNMLRG